MKKNETPLQELCDTKIDTLKYFDDNNLRMKIQFCI